MITRENKRKSNMGAKGRAAFIALALGASLIGFSTPAAAMNGASVSEVIQRRVQNAQVLDTHWQYECPRGIAGHDIGKYDVKYKTITFTNSFYVSDITPIAIKYVDNCSCPELGTATQYKYSYTLT